MKRTITHSSSTYEMKNEKGQSVVFSKVKEELDRMKVQFHIEIMNPIALMDQDTTKTFLSKCDPKSLYQYFVTGTHLEECKTILKEAKQNQMSAQDTLKSKRAQQISLRKEKEQWEVERQKHLSLGKAEEKLAALRKELASANAIQCAKEYDYLVEKYKKACKAVEDYQTSIDQEETDLLAFNNEKQDVHMQIEVIQNELQTFEDEIEGMRKEGKTIRAELNQLHRAKEKAKEKKNHIKSSLESVEAAIAKIRNTDSDAIAKATIARESQITELELKKEEMEATMQSKRVHLNNLENTTEDNKRKERELRNRINAAKSKTIELNRNLKKANSDGDNRLIIFGENVPKLVQMIQKNSQKFRQMPIGPLGMEVKLSSNATKSEHSLIENELQNILRAFLVDNSNDRQALQVLAKKCGIHITIITSKFTNQQHDISRGKCQHPDFPSIYDLLEISNPNVANCLIDQKKIERIILMRKNDEAMEIMKSQSSVPRNCLYALTGEYYQYYPAPSYKSYALNQKKLRPVLTASMAEHIASIEKEIQESIAESEKVNQEMEKFRKETDHSKKEFESDNRICVDLSRNIKLLDNKIFKLRQQNVSEKPPDMSALDDDRERFQEKFEMAEAEEQEQITKIKAVEELFNDKKALLTEKQNESEEKQHELEPLHEKIVKIDKKISKRKIEKELADSKMKKCTEHKNELKQQGIDKKLILQALSDVIKNDYGGDRVETKRNPKAIQKEIDSNEKMLAQSKKKFKPLDKVILELNRLIDLDAKLEYDLDFLDDLIVYLGRMSDHRKEGFHRIRAFLSRRIINNFSYYMGLRNFQGTYSPF